MFIGMPVSVRTRASRTPQDCYAADPVPPALRPRLGVPAWGQLGTRATNPALYVRATEPRCDPRPDVQFLGHPTVAAQRALLPSTSHVSTRSRSRGPPCCRVSRQANHRGLKEGALSLAHLPPVALARLSQAVADWLVCCYVISCSSTKCFCGLPVAWVEGRVSKPWSGLHTGITLFPTWGRGPLCPSLPVAAYALGMPDPTSLLRGGGCAVLTAEVARTFTAPTLAWCRCAERTACLLFSLLSAHTSSYSYRDTCCYPLAFWI